MHDTSQDQARRCRCSRSKLQACPARQGEAAAGREWLLSWRRVLWDAIGSSSHTCTSHHSAYSVLARLADLAGTIYQKLASQALKSSQCNHRMFPLEPLFFTSCWLTLFVLCLIYLFFTFLSFLPLPSHSHIPLTPCTTPTKYCIRTASRRYLPRLLDCAQHNS
jgi:hypothetical protein